MKLKKQLLIFIFMSMVLVKIAEYATIIKDGLSLIGKLGPEAPVTSTVVSVIVDLVLSQDVADRNAALLNEINKLRQEIEIRLSYIEKEISNSKLDILNQIKSGVYINGLGRELDILYSQLNSNIKFFQSISESKAYTENEKSVEIAYLIGKNSDWIKEGNMMFNIRKLAEILSGNTFVDIEGRNLYQIIYNANIPRSLFSGEAYDYSLPYIEKVMQVYFYGCSAMLFCLNNAMFVTNFTAKDIEALSPMVKEHYYSCAIGNVKIIEDEIEFLANKVYNISSEISFVTYYAKFIFKKKHERNIFLDMGHIPSPIPIADKLNSQYFTYENYHKTFTSYCNFLYCPWGDYCEDVFYPLLARIKKDVQSFADISAISPRQMDDFFYYFFDNTNFTNVSEMLSYLNDKGIDTAGELAEEIKKTRVALFPLFNFWANKDSCYYTA